MKEMGLEESDATSKSIKQLGILSMILGLDKGIIKDATAKLMDRIIRGDTRGHGQKSRRHQPSQIPKRLRDVARGRHKAGHGALLMISGRGSIICCSGKKLAARIFHRPTWGS